MKGKQANKGFTGRRGSRGEERITRLAWLLADLGSDFYRQIAALLPYTHSFISVTELCYYCKTNHVSDSSLVMQSQSRFGFFHHSSFQTPKVDAVIKKKCCETPCHWDAGEILRAIIGRMMHEAMLQNRDLPSLTAKAEVSAQPKTLSPPSGVKTSRTGGDATQDTVLVVELTMSMTRVF
jgi:hypothetical protein